MTSLALAGVWLNLTVLVQCRAGLYAPMGTVGTCLACSAGQYSLTGWSLCANCTAPPGWSCPAMSSNSTGVPCSAGQYCPGAGTPSAPCPAGVPLTVCLRQRCLHQAQQEQPQILFYLSAGSMDHEPTTLRVKLCLSRLQVTFAPTARVHYCRSCRAQLQRISVPKARQPRISRRQGTMP